MERCARALAVNSYDVIVIEKELVPWLPFWIEHLLLKRCHTPYIVDYDDALFHKYDQHRIKAVRWLYGKKLDNVMKHASVVIAGNEYLAARARIAGSGNVCVIPTAVPLRKYDVVSHSASCVFTIGWIGTPSTSKYLKIVHKAIREIGDSGTVRLVAIGAGPLRLDGVAVERLAWSEDGEGRMLGACDVGIMPLTDSPWERGKCGLKLIQYMACGLPVVASPVGVNETLVNDGHNGFKASTTSEWVKALVYLLKNPSERSRMGAAGRKLVEAKYCTDVTGPMLLGVLRAASKKCVVN